jgi:poly(3-hydroxyalkanoate) depolymerase
VPEHLPHGPTPARREVKVGYQRLRVDIRPGDGTGAPLLMFGGIGASLEVLQPLVDALDSATEVIRVDVPGVGGSPAGLPYTLSQLAWLMTRVLDALGYRKVDVLGYSWGGALAQHFAVQHAGRCRRLVLISTSTGLFSVPGDARVLTKVLTPGYFSDPDAVVLMADRVDGGVVNVLTDDMRKRLRGTVTVGGLGYLHQLAAVSTWTSLALLSSIRQPVLILSGNNDPIVPAANARIMAGLIPNSTLRIFAGGHAAIITAAPELGDAIASFVA